MYIILSHWSPSANSAAEPHFTIIHTCMYVYIKYQTYKYNSYLYHIYYRIYMCSHMEHGKKIHGENLLELCFNNYVSLSFTHKKVV